MATTKKAVKKTTVHSKSTARKTTRKVVEKPAVMAATKKAATRRSTRKATVKSQEKSPVKTQIEPASRIVTKSPISQQAREEVVAHKCDCVNKKYHHTACSHAHADRHSYKGWLNSDSFWKRAFAVYGYSAAAGLVIIIPFYILVFLFFIISGAAL